MIRLRELKKFFFLSLIGSLIFSAIVAVITILVGEFNEITSRVLITLFMVIFHSLASLSFIWDDEKQKTFEKLSFFSNVLFILIVASFFTSIFGIWEIVSHELIFKIYQTYFIVAFAALHADILSKALHKETYIDIIVYANYIFMAFVFVLLLPPVYANNSLIVIPEFYFRVLGAMGIIDGTLSVMAIILYKLFLYKHPKETDALAANFTSIADKIPQKKGLSIWVWILLIYLLSQIILPIIFFGFRGVL